MKPALVSVVTAFGILGVLIALSGLVYFYSGSNKGVAACLLGVALVEAAGWVRHQRKR